MYKKKQFPSKFLFEPTALHKKIIEKNNNDQKYLAKFFETQQANNKSFSNSTCNMSYSDTKIKKKSVISSNGDYKILSKILYINKKESNFGFSVRGGQDVGFLAKIAFIYLGKCFPFLNICFFN